MVEEWAGDLEDDGSNTHADFSIKFLPFFTIFDIILLYFIEVKSQYCSSEKFKTKFPSAARRIRTGNLQGGWMYSDRRLLNAVPGITHQCASD